MKWQNIPLILDYFVLCCHQWCWKTLLTSCWNSMKLLGIVFWVLNFLLCGAIGHIVPTAEVVRIPKDNSCSYSTLFGFVFSLSLNLWREKAEKLGGERLARIFLRNLESKWALVEWWKSEACSYHEPRSLIWWY